MFAIIPRSFGSNPTGTDNILFVCSVSLNFVMAINEDIVCVSCGAVIILFAVYIISRGVLFKSSKPRKGEYIHQITFQVGFLN